MLTTQQMIRIILDLQKRVKKLEAEISLPVEAPNPIVKRGRPKKTELVGPPEPVTEI